MNAYPDTGFLCSLYCPDAHSARAAARMNAQSLPLPLVWLHHLEFRNALRLRVFRGEITLIQRDASLNALLADLAAGVFQNVSPSFDDVRTESERLSALHSEALGVRSLEILHVASALVLGLEEFLTFDHRQGALARAAALNTPSL